MWEILASKWELIHILNEEIRHLTFGSCSLKRSRENPPDDDTAPSETAPSNTARSDTAPSDTVPSDMALSDTARSDTSGGHGIFLDQPCLPASAQSENADLWRDLFGLQRQQADERRDHERVVFERDAAVEALYAAEARFASEIQEMKEMVANKWLIIEILDEEASRLRVQK